MSRVPDPCPRWAVFRLLQEPADERGTSQPPTSQISVMHDGQEPRLYCCHSLLTRDAADTLHVLSVGIDLAPALEAQAFDARALIAEVDAACRRGGGSALVPAAVAEKIRTVAHVLNIAWVADALASPASIICPRSRACPRQQPCMPQGPA